MAVINRRRFLQSAAGAAGALALGGPFQGFTALAVERQAVLPARCGPIPDLRDGQVRLHLPEGFQYRSFHDTEAADHARRRDPAARSPRRHGRLRRGRTATSCSSATTRSTTPGRPSATPTQAYDPMAQSGTTTIEVTPHGEVVHAYTSLNGTQMNCSGGRMPWGAWITCEETVNGPDVGPDFTGRQQHPADQAARLHLRGPGRRPVRPASRSPAAGRFAHEAVVVRPGRGHPVPDRGQLRLPVRVLPVHPGDEPDGDRHARQRGPAPDAGGQGPAQREPGRGPAGGRHATRSSGSTSTTRTRPSRTRPARPRRRPTTRRSTYVGNQGRAKGAAYFSRLEGQVYDHGVVYFTLDPGRRPGRGRPGADRRRLRQRHRPDLGVPHRTSAARSCIYESPGADTLDFPDNVTTSPRGTLILCEDNVNDNYLRGLTESGTAVQTSPSTGWSAAHRRDRASTTSSPARRSARTARRCSSTSRRRAASASRSGARGRRTGSDPPASVVAAGVG